MAQSFLEKWTVTADDFGMSASVNAGILDLVEKRLVKQVSVLAKGPAVGVELDALKAFVRAGYCRVGLHFSLLEHYQKEAWFLARQTLWPLSAADIKTAFRSQVHAMRTMGLAPQYVDGHHHVHVFPHVLHTIADEMRRENIRQIRIPLDRRLMATANFPVHVLALRARRIAREHGLSFLPFFYPQKSDWRRPKELATLMETLPGGELLTHPAIESHSARDHERRTLTELGSREAFGTSHARLES